MRSAGAKWTDIVSQLNDNGFRTRRQCKILILQLLKGYIRDIVKQIFNFVNENAFCTFVAILLHLIAIRKRRTY